MMHSWILDPELCFPEAPPRETVAVPSLILVVSPKSLLCRHKVALWSSFIFPPSLIKLSWKMPFLYQRGQQKEIWVCPQFDRALQAYEVRCWVMKALWVREPSGISAWTELGSPAQSPSPPVPESVVVPVLRGTHWVFPGKTVLFLSPRVWGTQKGQLRTSQQSLASVQVPSSAC